MSRGRKIIITQNVVLGMLFTDAVIRFLYSGIHGVRLLLIVLCVFVTITRLLTDVSTAVLKGAKRDKERTKADKRGAVPGIIWHKMRFQKSEPQDRDTAMYTAQVSR